AMPTIPPALTALPTATTVAPSATATAVPSSPTPTALPPTVTSTPSPVPGTSASWFAQSTVVGFYGRAFGVAPILGRVGEYQTIDDMAKDVDTWAAKVKAVNGGKPVIPEIHLIYALAMPCSTSASDDCLLYLEAWDSHLVDTYIKPAQTRGWQVFL